MPVPDCTDVCEAIMNALEELGFNLNDDEDHTDVLEALNKCKLVRIDGEKASPTVSRRLKRG